MTTSEENILKENSFEEYDKEERYFLNKKRLEKESVKIIETKIVDRTKLALDALYIGILFGWIVPFVLWAYNSTVSHIVPQNILISGTDIQTVNDNIKIIFIVLYSLVLLYIYLFSVIINLIAKSQNRLASVGLFLFLSGIPTVILLDYFY